MNAVVIFSDGRWVKRYFNDSEHRRQAMKDAFLAWLITTGSQSCMTHVSISFCGTTFDPAYAGNRCYETSYFFTHHPGLVAAVEVPLKRAPDFRQFEFGIHKTPWPTVARVACFGAIMVDDCVCDVMKLLNQCGCVVPRHVLSPARLYDWLVTTRKCHHALFRPTPHGRSATDRMAR